MTYCEFGSEPKPGATEIFSLQKDVIAAILTEEYSEVWWLPYVLPLLDTIVDLNAFCALVPPVPEAFTLADLVSPLTMQRKAAALFWYAAWWVWCQCKAGGAGCTTYTYLDGYPVPNELHHDQYVVEDCGAGAIVTINSVAFDLTGQILIQYRIPYDTAWSGVSGYGLDQAATPTWVTYLYTWPGEVLIQMWSNTSGTLYPAEICPYSTPPTEPPAPPATPPPTGYTPPSGTSCSTIQDVCSQLDTLRFALQWLMRNLTPASYGQSGQFAISGEGTETITADALNVTLDPLPPGKSIVGTDPQYLNPWLKADEIGWLAFGNEYGWRDRVMLHYGSQWVQPIPPDANELHWFLLPDITGTVTTYVATTPVGG